MLFFLFFAGQEFKAKGAVGVVVFAGVDFGAEVDGADGAAFDLEAVDVVLALATGVAFVAIAGEDALSIDEAGAENLQGIGSLGVLKG
jgi:hypothetical protein